MDVGIALPNFGVLGTRSDVVAIAQEAERLGYSSTWTTDHVMMARGQEEPYGHILEAVTTLGFVAALTTSLKLGISVIVLPMREPVLFAKQIATLDTLSEGRVVVGLGAGWNEREFRFLGANFDNRGRRYDEYIKALRELWTSPEPTYDGAFVSFSDALFSPRSVQRGGPLITLGGNSPATFRRVATLADGWHATGLSPATYAEGLRRIRERADGREILPSLRIRVGIDRRLPETRGASGDLQSTLDGSPAEILARIAEYRQAGVQELLIQFVTQQRAEYLEGMRRFAAEIRPHLD